MTRLYLGIFACVAWLTFPAVASAGKPTRSECTIGFRLDWSGVATQHNLVRNEMDGPSGAERIEPLTAMGFTLDRSALFLLFKSDCDSKQEMAAALIKYWRSKSLDLPAFERIPDPITHSPSTIDVHGPHWSDG